MLLSAMNGMCLAYLSEKLNTNVGSYTETLPTALAEFFSLLPCPDSSTTGH